VALGAVALWPSVAAGDPASIVPPRHLDAGEVPYPEGATGDATVVLTVVVDATGAVSEVSVREGAPPFADAAVASVRSWRFEPATRDGVPVVARILAKVTFHAPPPPAPPPEPPRPPVTPSPAPPAVAKPAPPLEVAVHGEREEPSTIHIPRSETQFVAGAFGDPLKVVEVLPGMAPWLSGLPYYYVRGSPPANVGYFVDGIRVPLLFHVGPGASTIAPPLVESVDLFPAAYPAQYGRYAGAVIAAETTPPVPDRARGEFSARVYDANASVETPFDSGRGSVFVGGRYGYTQLLTSIIVPDYAVGYWDYEARASHRVGSADALTVFAFGAHDELHYKGQPTFRIEYHRTDLRYDHAIPGGHVRVGATLQYDDTLTAVQTNTGAGESAALRGLGGRFRVELDDRVSTTVRVRAGADAIATHYSVDDYPPIDGFAARTGPHTDFEGGAYADVVWRPARGVEVVPGFRFDGYRTRGQTTWAPQPRLSTRIQLWKGAAWVSAMGVAHEEPTEEILIPGSIPNPIDQSSQTIYQFSEGIDFRLPASLHARVSGFYSRLSAMHLLGTDLSERGQSEGLEVFLRRDFTERFAGFVSYTLARTVALSPNGGAEQRTSWDRTHVLSVVLGYDLGNQWRVGARVFVESGRPSQPECLTIAPGTPPAEMTCTSPGSPPPRVPTYTAIVTPPGDLPVFWRLDVRLEKRWLFRNGAWLGATLECFNTFDKAEPIGDQFVPGGGSKYAITINGRPVVVDGSVITDQSPIILPSVGVEGGF
jgi:TonB family protein